MKRLKIVHIGNPSAFKNISICKYFAQKGHSIHFIPTSPIENQEEGITYHSLDFNSLRFGVARRFYRIRKLIHKIKPDIVHAHHGHGPGWIGAIANYHPLILHAFGSDVLPEQGGVDKLRHKLLTKLALRRSDKIIVTGKHMIDSIVKVFNISSSKIIWLPRGVDLNLFKPEGFSHYKKEIGLTNEFPIVFSPRYLLDSVYNIDIIFESIRLVKEKYDNVLLLQLINDEQYNSSKAKSILDTIKKSNLQKNIKLISMVNNIEMATLYNISDMCVSVPSSDGFPVTILEASGCGTPFIVSDLPYVREYIEHSVNGLIVPVRDTKALTNAIITLADDSKLREMFSLANVEKVKEYDVNNCMQALLDIYYKEIRTK